MKRIFTLALLACSFFSNAQTLTQSNFTCTVLPQVMASGTSTRLPVVFRATLNGLTANTMYRYYINLAARTDFGTTNPGAGNPLFPRVGSSFLYTTSASLTNNTGYDSLTTDASGNYSGWFSVINTGNSRFTAGSYVFPSIVMDSAGSKRGVVNARYAATDSIQVLAFASTAGANNGTGIWGSSFGTEKNIVALYDNTTGTGRPITVTYLENIGTTIASVVPYYSTNVQAVTGAWGTIIPNTLPNGIRRIQQMSLATGLPIYANTNATGIWPTGPANTVNPTGGTTPIVISSTDAALPLNLTSFTAGLKNSIATASWKTLNETNLYIFEIERSNDAISFYKVGTVKANNQSSNSYSFTDIAAITNNTYYRLKMIDKNGSFSYSSIVMVSSKATNTIAVFPNPAKNNLVVTYGEAKANATAKIVSIEGKVIASYVLPVGSTTNGINVSNLAAGTYKLVIENNNDKQTTSFIKL